MKLLSFSLGADDKELLSLAEKTLPSYQRAQAEKAATEKAAAEKAAAEKAAARAATHHRPSPKPTADAGRRSPTAPGAQTGPRPPVAPKPPVAAVPAGVEADEWKWYQAAAESYKKGGSLTATELEKAHGIAERARQPKAAAMLREHAVLLSFGVDPRREYPPYLAAVQTLARGQVPGQSQLQNAKYTTDRLSQRPDLLKIPGNLSHADWSFYLTTLMTAGKDTPDATVERTAAIAKKAGHGHVAAQFERGLTRRRATAAASAPKPASPSPAAKPAAPVGTVATGPATLIPRGITPRDWDAYQKVSRAVYGGQKVSARDLKQAHQIAVRANHTESQSVIEDAMKAAGVAVAAAVAAKAAAPAAKPRTIAMEPITVTAKAPAKTSKPPVILPATTITAKAPPPAGPAGVPNAYWTKRLPVPRAATLPEWQNYVAVVFQINEKGEVPSAQALALAKETAGKASVPAAVAFLDAVARRESMSVDELVAARKNAHRPRAQRLLDQQIVLAAGKSGTPSDLAKAHKIALAAGMTATAASLGKRLAESRSTGAPKIADATTPAPKKGLPPAPAGVAPEDWKRYWAVTNRMSQQMFDGETSAAPDEDYLLVEAVARKRGHQGRGAMDVVGRHFKASHNGVAFREYKMLLSTGRALAENRKVTKPELNQAHAIAGRLRSDKGDMMAAIIASALGLKGGPVVATTTPPSPGEAKPSAPVPAKPPVVATEESPPKTPPMPTRDTPKGGPSLPKPPVVASKDQPKPKPGASQDPDAPMEQTAYQPLATLPPILPSPKAPPVFTPPPIATPDTVASVPVTPPVHTIQEAARQTNVSPEAVGQLVLDSKGGDSGAQARVAQAADTLQRAAAKEPAAVQELKETRDGARAGDPNMIAKAVGIAAAGAITGAAVSVAKEAKRAGAQAPVAASTKSLATDDGRAVQPLQASVAGAPSGGAIALGVGVAGLGLLLLAKGGKKSATRTA